jgi:hypothetical protein
MEEQNGSRGVDGVGVQMYAPTALPSGKRLGTYFRAGWVDLRADLQDCGEEKNIMALTGIENQTDQPAASLCTDYCSPVRLFNPVNTQILSSLPPVWD